MCSSDLMSAVGDGEDEFDVMPGPAGSSGVGDRIDIPDDPRSVYQAGR